MLYCPVGRCRSLKQNLLWPNLIKCNLRACHAKHLQVKLLTADFILTLNKSDSEFAKLEEVRKHNFKQSLIFCLRVR